ncbi:hypothetical protein GCM10017691_63740 [Pseudonocardia petroleophila]
MFVEITGAPSSDWNGIDRSYVRPLRSFLQLCTLRESMVDQVEVQVGGNWIRLVASRIGGNALANQTADSVIRFSDIGIEPLAEWLDCVDDLGPTPAVVSDGITGSQDTIETQLLELTTVAEGLHRSIFPQEDRLTVDQAENVRLIVREAIKSEPSRVQDVVNGRFGYIEEMSYPHRLRAIAKEAAVALPEIAGRINRWADAVSTARNRFAHGTGRGVKEEETDELIGLIESLRWCLTTVLLLNCHTPAQVIADRFKSHQRFEHYTAQVKVSLPRVYAE